MPENEYVNRCTLEFNGQTFEDFNTFTDNEEEYAVQVDLMNKTGFAEKTLRHGFGVTAVRPVGGYPFDLRAIKGGTFTVEYPSGKRDTYGNVWSLTKGEGTIDNDTPLEEVFTFGASSKIEQ